MTVLLLGLAVFFAVHSVRIVAPGYRDAFIARHGDNAWKVVYALASLVGLVLVVWGYGIARADPVVIWVPPVWTRHLALLVMLPVFVLLLAAYLPGRIRSTLRHPMLAAVKLWALAHLLANGALADILLFGSFLAWAIADRISVKRRAGQPAPAALRPGVANDAIAVVGGLVIYLAFVFYLHRLLFGVAPIG